MQSNWQFRILNIFNHVYVESAAEISLHISI